MNGLIGDDGSSDAPASEHEAEIERLRYRNHLLIEERKLAMKRDSEQADQLFRLRLLLKKIRGAPTYQAGTALRLAFDRPLSNLIKLPARLLKLARGQGLSLKDHYPIHLDQIPKDARGYDGAFPEYSPAIGVRPGGPRVAAIMDEFSYNCLMYEWDVTKLSKANWKDELQSGDFDFLFVESAWRGNGGQWKGLVNKFAERPDNPLRDLVDHCRETGLPTVFWNKEDPPHFNVFVNAALAFDYIFTTDEDCIPKYRELAGHDRVFALPFAAQPAIHNPMRRTRAWDREVAFAGGWHSEHHDARRVFLRQLLDGAIESGVSLDIYDRFSDLPEKERERHRFPDVYEGRLKDRLPYEQMVSAYRAYPVFLNVNSVTESPSMFSRRVFELLACGANVVSSPSVGMERMLGDYVATVTDQAGTRAAVNELASDPRASAVNAHLGYRAVMERHTYSARTAFLESKVLKDREPDRKAPLVSVIMITNRPDRFASALENYRRQGHRNKELIIGLNSDDFDIGLVRELISDIKDVHVFSIPEEKTLASGLNFTTGCADGEYWAKFDDDDLYGENYLSDALIPFSFSGADIVGKGSYFAKFENEDRLYHRRPWAIHRLDTHVCGGTLVARRDVMEQVKFKESVARGADTDFLRRADDKGLTIYSADCYNFVQIRRGAGENDHTWKIDRNKYLENCQVYAENFNTAKVMI